MNCSLSKSISDVCKNNRLFAGGVRNKVYLFKNTDTDFSYLENRLDSLIVTGINGDDFYELDMSAGEYSLSASGDQFKHTLQGQINNTSHFIQEGLSSSQNDRFTVLFYVKGDGWKAFGTEFGATLSYKQNIGTSEAKYDVTFEYMSDYALYDVEPSALPSDDKVYEIYRMLQGGACEVISGSQTGYRVFTRALYVSRNGSPLDRNGRLASVTGNQQACDVLEGHTAEGYDVVGTYATNAVIDGKNVRVLDLDCPSEAEGTISIVPDSVIIGTSYGITTRQVSVVVDEGVRWSMLDTPNYCNICDVFGDDVRSGVGPTDLIVRYALGGVDNLRFINIDTGEIAILNIESYVLQVNDSFVIDSNENIVTITPSVYGGDATYHYTITPEPSQDDFRIYESNGSIVVVKLRPVEENTDFAIDLIHDNYAPEHKIVIVTAKAGTDTKQPRWEVVTEYCEIE